MWAKEKRNENSKTNHRPDFYFGFCSCCPSTGCSTCRCRTNADILGPFPSIPRIPTFGNYMRIFTDKSWYSGYINSIIYVSMNTLISLSVALPAAYAFSRYHFVGDGQIFFWLLTNRMAPAAVFLLPFLPAVLHLRPDRYPYRRSPGPLFVQRALWRYGSLEGFHVGGAQRDRRDRLYRRVLLSAFFHHLVSL
jgi:hypothetical protein